MPFDPDWHSFSPDGERIALSDPFNLAVVSARTGALVWHTEALSRVGPPLWVSSGESILVGGEGGLAVVDAVSGNLVRELPGHQGGVFSYAAVPGTILVASAGEVDGETIIFDLGDTSFEVGGFTSSFQPLDIMGFVDGSSSLWAKNGGGSESGAIIDSVTGDLEASFPAAGFPRFAQRQVFRVDRRRGPDRSLVARRRTRGFRRARRVGNLGDFQRRVASRHHWTFYPSDTDHRWKCGSRAGCGGLR